MKEESKYCESSGCKRGRVQSISHKKVSFEGTNKIGIGGILLVPEIGCNLLGWDLQMQLAIGVLPKEGQMVVRLLSLRQEDKKRIQEIVWARPGNQGKLNMTPIVIKIVDENLPVQVWQYPLSHVVACSRLEGGK